MLSQGNCGPPVSPGVKGLNQLCLERLSKLLTKCERKVQLGLQIIFRVESHNYLLLIRHFIQSSILFSFA